MAELPDVALEEDGPVLVVQRHPYDLPLRDAPLQPDLRRHAPHEEAHPAPRSWASWPRLPHALAYLDGASGA